ncbi:MAG: nucleotidyltransferase [Candidatus Aminicenantes bacterium]|nr:MAG: nucleotidyltransferase [Candidatus Aminicenantes bacterium]
MALKRLPADFRDFLNSLNKNGVRYLLVGGWAVGIYGHPRATGDMDVLIAIDDANLDKLLKAFYEFGAPTVEKNHFKEKGNVFRMGRSPIKIDVINEASGIDIDDCYSRRNVVHIDGIDISLISKEDLIKNKKASGRTKDIADVEDLEDIS